MATNQLSHLANLQHELLLEIVDHLTDGTVGWQQDIRNWSATSSQFRSFLTPHIFQGVTLRNTEGSGALIDALAKSTYRHDVRVFTFTASASQDQEDGSKGIDIDSLLPENVEKILSDLSVFPNLKMVCIGLDLELEDDLEEEFGLFEDVESPDEVKAAEQRVAWRALNTKMYAVLARNTNPGFTELALDDLVPVEASSFNSPEFRNLLSHMRHFTISQWTDFWDSGKERRPACLHFYLQLDRLFFDHLSSIRDLDIYAIDVPIRIYRSTQTDLQSPSLRMPVLENFHLSYSVINNEIEALLVSHSQTLKSVKLGDCYATESDGHLDNFISWERLFKSLKRAKPAQLRTFILTSRDEPELCSKYQSSQQEKDEAALILTQMRTRPERRLFPYAYLQEYDGYRRSAWKANRESFILGQDQKAYDELMQLVKFNTARSKKVGEDANRDLE